MTNLTFDQLPEAVSQLQIQLNRIEQLISEKSTSSITSDEVLTVSEAAAFLDLAPQTVYQKVSARELPFSKRGKRLYFLRSELEQWIAEGRKSTQKELRDSI